MGFADSLASADRTIRLMLDGSSITYTPGVGSPVTVPALFDNPYERVDSNTGHTGVASSDPTLFIELALLPSDALTDEAATVTVSGTVYRITELKPDGLTGVLLKIQKVS